VLLLLVVVRGVMVVSSLCWYEGKEGWMKREGGREGCPCRVEGGERWREEAPVATQHYNQERKAQFDHEHHGTNYATKPRQKRRDITHNLTLDPLLNVPLHGAATGLEAKELAAQGGGAGDGSQRHGTASKQGNQA
jgi:hypothetical protein